jgi:hypothetical protein
MTEKEAGEIVRGIITVTSVPIIGSWTCGAFTACLCRRFRDKFESDLVLEGALLASDEAPIALAIDPRVPFMQPSEQRMLYINAGWVAEWLKAPVFTGVLQFPTVPFYRGKPTAPCRTSHMPWHGLVGNLVGTFVSARFGGAPLMVLMLAGARN